MTNNRITIHGPELPTLVYGVKVNHLSSGAILELTDGRWGVRTVAGVVIFGGNSGDSDISFLHIMNDTCQCRELSGKVEITYKPVGDATMNKEGTIDDVAVYPSRLTVEELEALVRRLIEELNQQRRGHV